MSKDPGLGGPLGGLYNILFPKKKQVSKIFSQSGIWNKYIIHIVFMTMCMNVAKEPIFFIVEIIFFYIFAHICFEHVPRMTQDSCYKLEKMQLSAVVIYDNQFDEFLCFNCTKNSTLKNCGPGPPRPGWQSM